MTNAALEVGVLGDLRVARAEQRVELPQSKKARALLGYLVITGRAHRRVKLSELLWDVADDPRGALRWTLSRLRPVLDDPQVRRLVADREEVAVVTDASTVDLVVIRRMLEGGVDRVETSALERAASAFRGELLEGLDLPDFYAYSAWLAGQREEARRLRAAILAALSLRLADRPEEALPHARIRAQIDPLDESAQLELVRLLVRARRGQEAEQQCDTVARLLKELGVKRPELIATLRAELKLVAPPDRSTSRPSAHAPLADGGPAEPPGLEESFGPLALVGRRGEMSALLAAQQRSLLLGRASALLLTGEPGIGKSRLLEEVERVARGHAATVLRAAAHEAGMGLPFGAWIEALQPLGKDVPDPFLESNREAMCRAVARLVEDKARAAPPVVLLFDDVQWLDEASAALLHHVLHTVRSQPLFCVLAARNGELADNRALLGVLRGWRRARTLQELVLPRLDPAEVRELAHAARATLDVGRIIDDCGGNPLFALELARWTPRSGASLPESLGDLVADRVERLDPSARDVLRWASVLGASFDVHLLEALTELGTESLLVSLEALERHAFLRSQVEGDGAQSCAFSHELLQRAVYTRISEPRRRLMHRRIAEVMETAEDDPRGHRTGELARHAALGGDAAMAARACLRAGRRCLQLFASGDARTFAERGLMYVASLDETQRVSLEIDLRQVLAHAGPTDDIESAVAPLFGLAERALDGGDADAARTAFLVIGLLRWQDGKWGDAGRVMMRVEAMARAGDEIGTIHALGEAGHCLALLERDLPRAEAMLLEARALSDRREIAVPAVSAGLGFLFRHRGDDVEATRLLEHGRARARVEGSHWGEFEALVQLVELDYESSDLDRAASRCDELLALAEKMREGSELPYARCMRALIASAGADATADAELAEAIVALRASDAHQRLAAVLIYAAELDLDRGRHQRGLARATEAASLAKNVERRSDVALALAAVVRAAATLGERLEGEAALSELEALGRGGLSRRADRAFAGALGLGLEHGKNKRSAQGRGEPK